MTFQQTENWNDKSHTELSIVRPVAPVSIIKSDYSIVMYGPIASCLRYKLSMQFDVTQHTASLNMDSFDAVFIDCRGTEIQSLHTIANYRHKLTLVLVDEHTKLPEQLENNGTHVELITKAELGCKVLELRICKYKRQHPQHSKSEASNSSIEAALDYKRQSQLIASASHDLRQPMHAIGLFIESLKNQIVDSNQRSTLEKLKQSSTELNQLLNNILGFSKLDINNNSVAKTQRDSTNSKTLEMLETYKLLVIDDNPAVLSAMQMMLGSMNCDVYPASDIPEALEIIKELDELPDLLVVDYQLANGVTGCTAIEQICKAANNELPAIIVTGNTNSELYQRARKHGHRVLSKPVNPKILLDTIASTIENHRHLVA